jgi:hypothetical protein
MNEFTCSSIILYITLVFLIGRYALDAITLNSCGDILIDMVPG